MSENSIVNAQKALDAYLPDEPMYDERVSDLIVDLLILADHLKVEADLDTIMMHYSAEQVEPVRFCGGCDTRLFPGEGEDLVDEDGHVACIDGQNHWTGCLTCDDTGRITVMATEDSGEQHESSVACPRCAA